MNIDEWFPTNEYLSNSELLNSFPKNDQDYFLQNITYILNLETYRISFDSLDKYENLNKKILQKQYDICLNLISKFGYKKTITLILDMNKYMREKFQQNIGDNYSLSIEEIIHQLF